MDFSDEELQKSIDADEPPALFEKGRRLLENDDIASARKFLTLASILGNKDAHSSLARIYEEEDNFEEACRLYTLAYSNGDDSVLPNLARLLMIADPALGFELLKEHAYDGNAECIKELVEIYEKDDSPHGKKELKFWQTKLAGLEKKVIETEEKEKKKPADKKSADKK